MSVKSRYSHEDRKNIARSIENLKSDKDYKKIFNILMNDKSNTYSQNSNGVFLNLSVIEDGTLRKITKYIYNLNKNKITEIETEIDILQGDDILNERTYKLSNYEKNILKQRNLKKVLNDEKDYQEFRLSSKKKSVNQKI